MIRWLLGLLLIAGLALAHPSNTAEGALGELKFDNDLELPAETLLEAWFEITTLTKQPIAIKDCVCTLLVYKGQALASARPLLQLSLDRFEFEMIFPTDGLFTVVLLGRPRPNTNLQPFKLSYLVNVRATR